MKAMSTMTPKRSPRILALLIAATLVGALFASPAWAAKPVKPGGTAAAVPDTVSPSTAEDTNYVRFDVTFTNSRSSSLQQVTMTAETPFGSDLEEVVVDPFKVNPTGGVVGPFGSCDDSGTHLICTLGTLESLYSVKLSVVYEVPVTTASAMTLNFIFRSTGAPDSDPSASHGDDYPVSGTVVLTSSNFAGSYLYQTSDPDDVDTLDVATNQLLTKRGNPQSTRVTGPAFGIPVTASEVAASNFTCPEEDQDGNSVECFGQWSVINVNNHADYTTTGGIVVVIGYDQVPGNANDVGFVHLVGAGSTFITESCSNAIPVDCIDSVDNVNGDLFYTLILGSNGPLRGF
jgi:hypothetical protein